MMVSCMRCLSRGCGQFLFALGLTFALLSLPPAARPDEPPVFAITNARVIPVAGAPIEKGTVVLRNGIIEAVGTNVAVPPDARVFDATGMTVYPGLIDALSDIGLEEVQPPAASRTAAAPQAQQPVQQSPEERQGVTPYRQVVDLLSPANRRIEAARSAGITTTLVAPRRGYFTGQSSLLNLSGSSVGRMVVRTPVAFHINLAARLGSGGEYPGSLMGAFALVKQTLMDAQQYGAARAVYDAQPGAARPEYSKALEALQPLIRREFPAVLPGNTPAEIQRALDLAETFNLKLVLSGGMEAGKIGSVLKDRSIPVLLSVKFPERDRDADPDAREELGELRRRVEAPSNASALAKAGVSFAFQSDDMANPADFIRNVRRVVDAGLDRNTALRALTLTPAEIFGAADRLGSIEKGKTANLVLTTGDIFDPKTRVKWVFVDGQKFEPAEPEPSRAGEDSGRPAGQETPAPPNVAGNWTLSVNTPQGAMDVTVVLRQSGSSLSGSVTSYMGTTQIQEGSVTGNNLVFKISVEIPGQGSLPVTFAGTVRGNGISGSADAGPMGKMDFTGTKSPGGH